MESKYIENTNQQYSIREDGMIFIHYRIKRITNTRKDKITCNDVLSIIRDNSVDISYTDKIRRKSINSLLFEHFGYKICNQCSSKFIPNISPVKCDNCRKTNKKVSANKYAKEWYKNNTELAKQIARNNNKKVTKTYVAQILDIKSSNLTDELYNDYRNLILLKRRIAKENNISIHLLK